jgi:uncharacterized protein (DUF2252 family)
MTQLDIDSTAFPLTSARGKLKDMRSFAEPRPGLNERRAEGKALRDRVPRSAHRDYRLRKDGGVALAMIEKQNASRVAELVPIRMARMAASPFSYLRGSAAVMAADLATTQSTGLEVVACGDMHVMNFGLFASAERDLVFAINDFDEVHPGAWEWDLKRLAASAAVAIAFMGGGRARAQEAAWEAVASYIRRIDQYAGKGYMETWYDVIDEEVVLAATAPSRRRMVRKVMEKARTRGPVRALDKLTTKVGGEHRIVEDAPLISHETHLPSGLPITNATDRILRAYVASLPLDRQMLLSRYRVIDVARKVVGVGSVGTSCWVILCEGRDSGDPLLLQAKEAQESVLAPYAKRKFSIRNQGQRVVVGQRLIQGSPDIFLGWGPEHETTEIGDFYVRQLADMKGGINITPGDDEMLEVFDGYCRLCGWALALAHAKSGDPARIAGYCGLSDALPDAISTFALAYLEQTEGDHTALMTAVRQGKITLASPTEAGLA